MALLFVLFVGIPVLELWVIFRVGDAIGFLPTLLALLGAGLLGAWLARREGGRAWGAFRAALAEGRWPGQEVAEGALVLVGATLLVTPGFVTDLAGLLMVAPPTRRLLAGRLRRRFGGGRGASVMRRVRSARPTTRSDQSPQRPTVEVVSIERTPPAE